MDEQIVDLYLKDPPVRQEWERFLTSIGIHNFADKEVDQIDYTIGIYSGDDLVATGSVAGSVLKYIGVCNKGVTTGARFNAIVSELVNRQFANHVFHLMVFTKLKYSESFQHIGFSELARSNEAALLETGSPDVADFLSDIPRVADQANKKVAGIVMNANPFTLGHRFLVEQAARANDLVYVFVVNTDASLFTTDERTELVKANTQDLANVIVVNGGDYMVSYATFPAYFLASTDETVNYQTTLDARIFRNVIAPALSIKTRYVGSEPLSRTTGIYNQVLARELPPAVELKVIERNRVNSDDATIITATKVRQLIKTGELKQLPRLVPAATTQFIQDHLKTLQARIQKGMNIDGN
ncbi:[citrate (pro-3S)-lyase] ligase [Secundilactobacillus folii]|uniref:[Citrate [pro-3S]-lyase] ligase n=1 Tax=Secundilactobacillus folii TaxID=2678357 RepID=A0A7X3C1R8_9LACO|nr:[citrate (pro-3S)-lyase] ligase [Secundilactobacillus folii]MTV82020.1 [citrate (pro-3S)-lyase] ligase [Secundilactobacillus folii]